MIGPTVRFAWPVVLLLAAGCGGAGRSGSSTPWVPPGRTDLQAHESHTGDRYDYVVFVRAPAPPGTEPYGLCMGSDTFWFGDSDRSPLFRLDYDESWRGSVRIGGRTYWLPNGRVFLCDVTEGKPKVRQLRIHLPPARYDPSAPDVGKHLATTDRRVAAFLHTGGPGEPGARPTTE